jgi:hypothetical protein
MTALLICAVIFAALIGLGTLVWKAGQGWD